MQGRIPPELWALTDLWVLSLAKNALTGELPSELGNLVGLQELYVHGNRHR